MNNKNNHTENWTACEPGTLGAYARQIKADRRKQTLTRVTGISLLVLCAIGVGIWGATRPDPHQEHYFGGIACSQVQKNMSAYSMGDLPPELKSRIAVHLKECPDCQALMKQMGASRTVSPHVECTCSACRQLAKATLQSDKYHDSHHGTLVNDQSARMPTVLVADAR